MGTYEFFSLRPQIVAYAFLLFNLFAIFFYLKKDKNILLLTLPVTLLWTNLHGSVVVNVYLFTAYTLICIVYYLMNKEKRWLGKIKTLGAYTLITIALTLLPPLGTLQYEFIRLLLQNRASIAKFIAEWQPLSTNPLLFYAYSFSAVITVILFTGICWKQKAWKNVLWVFPLLPFIAFAYTSQRNVYFGYLVITILLGYVFSSLHKEKVSQRMRVAFIGIGTVLVLLQLWIFSEKMKPIKLYYPTNAARFIKENNMQGTMFNEYNYGGYLLYTLYPKQKVFIDGRAEVYLCCEIPSIDLLFDKKLLPDKEYQKILNAMWDQYAISFAVIKTKEDTYTEKVAKILTDDPEWNLIFWDDTAQIFLRNDGKNPVIADKFKAIAATPYSDSPFHQGAAKVALEEYKKMTAVADSARSRNAIGFIYALEKKYAGAETEFLKAIQLDNTYESPYMNLAELAITKSSDYDKTIALYKKALTLAPKRPFIYMRLGELYIKGHNDYANAETVWRDGAKRFKGMKAENEFRERLRNISR